MHLQIEKCNNIGSLESYQEWKKYFTFFIHLNYLLPFTHRLSSIILYSQCFMFFSFQIEFIVSGSNTNSIKSFVSSYRNTILSFNLFCLVLIYPFYYALHVFSPDAADDGK